MSLKLTQVKLNLKDGFTKTIKIAEISLCEIIDSTVQEIVIVSPNNNDQQWVFRYMGKEDIVTPVGTFQIDTFRFIREQ